MDSKVAKHKTATGELARPVRRLNPLELSAEDMTNMNVKRLIK